MGINRSIWALSVLQDRRYFHWHLYVSVTLCAIMGVVFASNIFPAYHILIYIAISSHTTIIGSIIAFFLPNIVFSYVISILKPLTICLICGLRIFFFSAEAFVISITFGSAAWLISVLFLFADIFLIPVLLYHVVKCFRQQASTRSKRLVCIYIFIIGIVYYIWISPFLVDLMNIYNSGKVHSLCWI